MQTKKTNLIALVAIQTIDSDQAQHLHLHLSVDSQDLPAEEDPCSMMRYRLKSFSIDSLEAEEWEDLLVGYARLRLESKG